MNLIQRKIKDDNSFWLIGKIIKSFSTALGKGLPLGNITSQLFVNIYLNELDRFVKQELGVRYYIRYCDDFVILSEEQNCLYNILINTSRFLNEKLKLSLHSDKIIMRKYHQGTDFLGYVDFPYHKILRIKTRKRMFKKIDKKIQELKRSKILRDSFNQTIQSYFGVLKHCNSYGLRKKLIDYLRKKV